MRHAHKKRNQHPHHLFAHISLPKLAFEMLFMGCTVRTFSMLINLAASLQVEITLMGRNPWQGEMNTHTQRHTRIKINVGDMATDTNKENNIAQGLAAILSTDETWQYESWVLNDKHEVDWFACKEAYSIVYCVILCISPLCRFFCCCTAFVIVIILE